VSASISLFSTAVDEIAISELDIQAFDARGGSAAVIWNEDTARQQARQYAAMFSIFLQHQAVISRVTFWGLDDRTSWRSSSCPVLFDKDYKTKPAFYAVANPSQY
jgi:endo-1,4-beta-xylanase